MSVDKENVPSELLSYDHGTCSNCGAFIYYGPCLGPVEVDFFRGRSRWRHRNGYAPCGTDLRSVAEPAKETTRPDLGQYKVVSPDWAIPRDVVAIEHHSLNGQICLVASSTLPRTVVEVLQVIEDHEKKGC